MQNTSINRKGKQRKSSVEEARENKIDQKELMLLGMELHHLQIQSIYGLNRVYAVYIRSAKSHVWSGNPMYGYGYTAYPDD
jgi:hypothetical protein